MQLLAVGEMTPLVNYMQNTYANYLTQQQVNQWQAQWAVFICLLRHLSQGQKIEYQKFGAEFGFLTPLNIT